MMLVSFEHKCLNGDTVWYNVSKEIYFFRKNNSDKLYKCDRNGDIFGGMNNNDIYIIDKNRLETSHHLYIEPYLSFAAIAANLMRKSKGTFPTKLRMIDRLNSYMEELRKGGEYEYRDGVAHDRIKVLLGVKDSFTTIEDKILELPIWTGVANGMYVAFYIKNGIPRFANDAYSIEAVDYFDQIWFKDAKGIRKIK